MWPIGHIGERGCAMGGGRDLPVKRKSRPRVARWLKGEDQEPVKLPRKLLSALSCQDCKRLLGKKGVYYGCCHDWHGRLWPAGVLLLAVADHLPVRLPAWYKEKPQRAVNDLLRLARMQGRV